MESGAPEVGSNEDDPAALTQDHPAPDRSSVQPTGSADPMPTAKPSSDEAEMGGEAPCQLHRWWDAEA